jgi:hypothetical protein
LALHEKFFFHRKNWLKNEKKNFSHGGPKEKVPWERVGIFLRHPVVTQRASSTDFPKNFPPKKINSFLSFQKQTESFGKTFVYKQPLGVVLVISAFNFPISLSIRPMAAALAAGNTVILKPSEHSENAANALNETLSKAFPPELVSIVEGDAEASSALLEERFDHIFYTGSPNIGRVVMSAAAQHLTPVTLELGGKWWEFLLVFCGGEKCEPSFCFLTYFCRVIRCALFCGR